MKFLDSTSKAEEENHHHDGEDDEALSLCDLPENRSPENEEHSKKEAEGIKIEEDFYFRSWSGRTEMCVADEVFFKGQILPLRHSISSDSGLIGFRIDSHCVSRSESMDHGGVSRLTSLSSRSSSSGSGISSSSWSSIATTAKIPKSKQSRIRNNFHAHPSPKPQIKLSKSRPSVGSRSQRSSSAWDFFRLGLIRAPDLELQDFKARNSLSKPPNFTPVSRNSSSSSSSSSNKINNNQNPRRGFFGGCKCSVDVAETAPPNKILAPKSSKNERSAVIHGFGVEEKLLSEEVKTKAKMKGDEKKKGKQALSRYRTFEWLKQLSHAGYGNVDDRSS